VDADALVRALASLRVYRTYVEPGRGVVADEDRRAIAAAGMDPSIADMLLLERPAPPEFVTRFQQTTPAVTAKGVEDTAFYRYGRLLALNEVGGDPGRFGIGVERFHEGCLERARRFPSNLLTTQTHDTKRSADVRGRLTALASMPGEWEAHVSRWFELTEALRDGDAPDDVERYFLFQTLVGAWPIELPRVQGYMEKALREAKRNSNWIEPDTAWEQDVLAFCRALYSHREFLADFEPFVEEVTPYGDRIALGMVALKLTAPGVPDIYQGDELEFRALVDPDNRRTVDWDWNGAMLARLQGGSPPDRHTAKLWLTMRLLGLRLRRPEAFAGSYQPLDAGEQCVAYLRGGEVLVVVSTRRAPPAGDLNGIEGAWRDVLRGERRRLLAPVSLRDLLGRSAVAVLETDKK
jgi:(1->4)-alpha-D-glucan 1-alpha-D-glucosylmutase